MPGNFGGLGPYVKGYQVIYLEGCLGSKTYPSFSSLLILLCLQWVSIGLFPNVIGTTALDLEKQSVIVYMHNSGKALFASKREKRKGLQVQLHFLTRNQIISPTARKHCGSARRLVRAGGHIVGKLERSRFNIRFNIPVDRLRPIPALPGGTLPRSLGKESI